MSAHQRGGDVDCLMSYRNVMGNPFEYNFILRKEVEIFSIFFSSDVLKEYIYLTFIEKRDDLTYIALITQ